jgi:hypothetical protein
VEVNERRALGPVDIGRPIAWWATMLLFVVACGSSPSTGLDPALALNAMSPADLRALCDWTANQQGGYGAMIDCDAADTGLLVEKDQATCLAVVTPHWTRPTCTATVGDWMMCVQWRLSNWCSANPPPPMGRCEALQNGCYGPPVPLDAGLD